MQKHSFAGVYH